MEKIKFQPSMKQNQKENSIQIIELVKDLSYYKLSEARTHSLTQALKKSSRCLGD